MSFDFQRGGVSRGAMFSEGGGEKRTELKLRGARSQHGGFAWVSLGHSSSSLSLELAPWAPAAFLLLRKDPLQSSNRSPPPFHYRVN